MTRREEAVRKALESVPGSIRALAREAEVSEGLLRAIRDGRVGATPSTVEALAAALERWAETNADAARVLRDSLDQGDE